jgi:class 3 adenylate cyclase
VTACRACGTEALENARFCHGCGALLGAPDAPAEYKQVTVLFADVVRSMDVASAVGAERLREILAELVNRAKAVVERFGGTLDKFTGDGFMAVFGAPVALEDHAFRACLAALDIQNACRELAADVSRRDAVELRLRIGLNSGQVIAGEIGSAAVGYTAIGEQVGMAQRMESVAPPGGVMLSESTARLVAENCLLGDEALVSIKGVDIPVSATRLLAVAPEEKPPRTQSTLVGRELELNTMSGLLDRAMKGRGSVIGIVGPPGIGKSRLVGEAMTIARSIGVNVFSTYCESHASQIPFHAVARLYRTATRIAGLDDRAARTRIRAQLPDADADDLLLLNDLLGISDPDVTLPRIDADARRRRLGALINTVNLARTEPILYVMEDVHWIDDASEAMMSDVLAVISQTPAMAVITYRPEYDGALSRMHGAQTIALAPLTHSESSSLIGELLGPDPSNDALAEPIASRVAGNPFFAEEMVRELAQRGVLDGQRGNYVCRTDVADVAVPGTVQATIGARIDRLEPAAKRTLNAASVIGLRFRAELLTRLGVDPAIAELVRAELIDQVRFTPQAEFAFHHPLIRAVAYESQLKADRSEWHKRLAAVIEADDPESADENAALIAEHLEAAGEARAAYDWHMRAGRWSTSRDISAARVSWERARRIADSLPDDDPERTAMRIATRTKLSGTAWRRQETNISTLVAELRELCGEAGDNASLAIGITALALQQGFGGHQLDASRSAAEAMALLMSVGDPTLSIGAASASASIRLETGHAADVLRWAEHIIEQVSGGTAGRGTGPGSPLIALALIFRGIARWWMGFEGWRQDVDGAAAMASRTGPITRPAVISWKYFDAVPHGVLLPDDAAVRELEGALEFAEATGEDTLVGNLMTTLGRVLVERESPEDRQRGAALLHEVRAMSGQQRYSVTHVPVLDICIEREKVRAGYYSESIPAIRKALGSLFIEGQVLEAVWGTAVQVDALLSRNAAGDDAEACAAIDRLADLPDHVGGVMRDIWLLRLRALMARARGDNDAFRHYRDRHRAIVTPLGLEGHIQWAEEVTNQS